MTEAPDADPLRRALRERLRLERDAFVASPAFASANTALAAALAEAIVALEPERLGLYSALRSEFNAVRALAADPRLAALPLALPYARRKPRVMEFREWHEGAPASVDECGIDASAGPVVVPDVLVVPCLGFTADGHRLGHGGGYYDRWLAAHPHVTAIGVAWSVAEIGTVAFTAKAHDVALAAIVTERGVR